MFYKLRINYFRLLYIPLYIYHFIIKKKTIFIFLYLSSVSSACNGEQKTSGIKNVIEFGWAHDVGLVWAGRPQNFKNNTKKQNKASFLVFFY